VPLEYNLAYCDIIHHIFISAQHYATAPAPEKIEVFVNDKSLLVDPGITVLQVSKKTFHTHSAGNEWLTCSVSLHSSYLYVTTIIN